MYIKNLLISLLLALVLISCKLKRAPIEDHSRDYYTKSNHYNRFKYSNFKNAKADNLNNSKIKIKAGDSLYAIANQYGVSVRDLIKVNNLSAPYILIVGNELDLPVSQYYTVEEGDTLYAISRDYAVNVNELVSLNNLSSPYQLYAGQKLKISGDRVKKYNRKNYTQPKKTQSKFASRVLSNKNNKFSWPAKGIVISEFGPKKGGFYNDGINIKLPPSTAIKSTEEGLVAYVGNELKGYGNLIIIKHSGGWISAYGHLNRSLVNRGEKVEKSQTIAYSGATGNVSSPQLYFGLRKKRDAVNPIFYLKK